MTKKKILLLSMFLIAIFFGFMYIWDQRLKTEHIRGVETASVNVVKADLNLYYGLNNKYPRDINDVNEAVAVAVEGYVHERYKVQNSISHLRDFSYEIRGDDQAYKISYTNVDGKHVSEEVNYQADFHK